jgi:uncharacterized membrane protein
MSEQNPQEKNVANIPTASIGNPFQAPAAHVEDVRSDGDGALLDEPNRATAGQGSAWWSGGWELFREATGLWIGISVAFIVFTVLLSKIPFVGSLTNSLLMPVLSGGLMLGCRSLDSGEGLSFGHLFLGFRKNTGQLVLVGVLYLVGMIVIGLGILLLVFAGGMGGALKGGADMKALMSGGHLLIILLGILVAMVLFIPLAMANWFAPALVVFHDLSAMEAMKLSLKGCWRNNMPFLVYGIVGIFLAIAASIPIFLGWLLLAPTMICANYVSYREIFVAQDR